MTSAICGSSAVAQGVSKPNPKLRPPALRGTQAEVEAVGGEDLLHQGQPEAAAVPLGREEGGEEEGADLLGDAWSGVADNQGFAVQADGDGPVLADGFHGVLEHVHQHLLALVAVEVD